MTQVMSTIAPAESAGKIYPSKTSSALTSRKVGIGKFAASVTTNESEPGGTQTLRQPRRALRDNMPLEEDFFFLPRCERRSTDGCAHGWCGCEKRFTRDTVESVSVLNVPKAIQTFLLWITSTTMGDLKEIADGACDAVAKVQVFIIVSFGKASRKLFNSSVSIAIWARPATAEFALT
jgi:hypothetical protein